MTLARFLARVRSRLHRDESGFTIVESVIAIVLIFASLTALMYTATIGFRYIAYSRERVQATGYANQVMENIRGLAYAKVQSGLNSLTAHIQRIVRRSDEDIRRLL